MKLWLLIAMLWNPDERALYNPVVIERYALHGDCAAAAKYLKAKRDDAIFGCAYDYAAELENEDEKKKVRL